jgi:uncharacterized membrane protein YjgN (DUF898 family)
MRIVILYAFCFGLMAYFTVETGSVAVGLLIGFWIIVMPWLIKRSIGWHMIKLYWSNIKFAFAWLIFSSRSNRAAKRVHRVKEFIATADALSPDNIRMRKKLVDQVGSGDIAS